MIELLQFKKGKKKSKSKIIESIVSEAFGPIKPNESPKVLTIEDFRKNPPLLYNLILDVIKLSLPCG